MNDPYVYPDTGTLINKFDIRDAEKLQDLEAAFYRIRLAEPMPTGDLDYIHMKVIHHHLFGDLYEWAGQERIVDIAKQDSYFARKEFITPELNKIFTQLKSDDYLKELDFSNFCKKSSFYFNEINATHPFREGNGRTLRAFSDLLAQNAGFHFDWSKVQRFEYIEANIAGFNGDYDPMEKVFNKITSQLKHSQFLEFDKTLLNKETVDKVKIYVDKQVQLAEFVRQKNQSFTQDVTLAKHYAQEALILNQELKNMAKELILDPGSQNFFTQPQIVSLQNQGGFAKIQDRFEKSEIVIQDIQAVLKYAKEQASSISQTLNKSRNEKETVKSPSQNRLHY